MRTKPEVAERDAIGAVAAVLGERPLRARLVPTDEDNRVYALDCSRRTLFAKFGHRDRTLKEALAYRAASDAGVPVPAVLAHGTADADGSTFFVVEAARGVPVPSLAPQIRERAWRDLGRALRTLHGVRAAGFGGPDIDRLVADGTWVAPHDAFRPAELAEWALAYFQRKALLTDDEATNLRRHLRGLDDVPLAASSLLHSDATSECAYADPDTGVLTALIDFGDARCGPPAWEFSTFAVRDVDALHAVADGYGISLEEHRDVMSACAIVRMLGGGQYMYESGHPGHIERLESIRALSRDPSRLDRLWRR
jgi:aminoglycoside phosphotransferase (APT) family kinase protein